MISHNRAVADDPPRLSMILLASSSMPRILGAPRMSCQGIPSVLLNNIHGMNWNERISAARTKLGINKSEFARRVGVSTATTADWETGTIKMIDGKNLVKVASVLNVSPEWIITGAGSMDSADGDNDMVGAVNLFVNTYRHTTDEGRKYLLGSITAVRAAFVSEDRRKQGDSELEKRIHNRRKL